VQSVEAQSGRKQITGNNIFFSTYRREYIYGIGVVMTKSLIALHLLAASQPKMARWFVSVAGEAQFERCTTPSESLDPPVVSEASRVALAEPGGLVGLPGFFAPSLPQSMNAVAASQPSSFAFFLGGLTGASLSKRR
jgi:hypothetical protein